MNWSKPHYGVIHLMGRDNSTLKPWITVINYGDSMLMRINLHGQADIEHVHNSILAAKVDGECWMKSNGHLDTPIEEISAGHLEIPLSIVHSLSIACNVLERDIIDKLTGLAWSHKQGEKMKERCRK